MTADRTQPSPLLRLFRDNGQAEVGYRAFGGLHDTERPAFLDVRRKDGTGELIPYAHIVRVAYSGDTLVSLVCTGGPVTFEGRNLGELLRRLQMREAGFVQEFDAGRWEMPEEAVAVVSSIR